MTVPFDFHNHTSQSPDGENSPREMVERAIELGMVHYTITDHVEINKFYDEKEYLYEEPVKRSRELIPALANEYAEKINLHFGVELGQALHDMELTKRILSENDYDFIIGSCHMVRGYEDFYYLDYNAINPDYLMGKYFDELLEMAEWNGFDVLGHLTYPIRYITGEFGIKIDLSRYDCIIEKIFKTLIKNRKGIEINTSGLFNKIGELLPNEKYIKMYHDLGGEILTIGSDAHTTANLGRGINEGIAAAKRCGFSEVSVFVNRTPLFYKI